MMLLRYNIIEGEMLYPNPLTITKKIKSSSDLIKKSPQGFKFELSRRIHGFSALVDDICWRISVGNDPKSL